LVAQLRDLTRLAAIMGALGFCGGFGVFMWALGVVGCSSVSEAPNHEGEGGAGGTDNQTTQQQPMGSCKESALFPAEAHGDNGDDLIRGLQVDEVADEIYFSDLDRIYKAPLSGGKPTLLGDRPNDDIAGSFWLADQQILYPAGFATPVIEQQVAVVYSTDRTVGAAEVVVGVPSDPTGAWKYAVHDVQVVGDAAYWLGEDENENGETTYFLRRTSWRAPGDEPEEIYSSDHSLDSFIIAGNIVFIREELTPKSFEYDQVIVDLSTKGKWNETTKTKFGGEVVAGDAESVFVALLQLEPPYESGMFRMDHDGGAKAKVSNNLFSKHHLKQGDTWVFTDGQTPGDPTLVFSYRVGEEPKQIGCIDSAYGAHAVALSKSKAYVAAFGNKSTTIFQYDF
jgi:hypothetical protein